jgi:hypothetical protein
VEVNELVSPATTGARFGGGVGEGGVVVAGGDEGVVDVAGVPGGRVPVPLTAVSLPPISMTPVAIAAAAAPATATPMTIRAAWGDSPLPAAETLVCVIVADADCPCADADT